MNKKEYSRAKIAITNIQKHTDITAREVLDQEKRNSSDGNTEGEDIMQI